MFLSRVRAQLFRSEAECAIASVTQSLIGLMGRGMARPAGRAAGGEETPLHGFCVK
jgi:hypothetical protein